MTYNANDELISVGANPLMTKYADMQSPCVKQCADKLVNVSTSIDFTKNTNFGQRFSHLDGICRNISVARQCVNDCKVSFNMFDMKAMKVMCVEKTLAELKTHQSCYDGKSKVMNKICDKRCGGKIEDTETKLKHIVNASKTTAEDIEASMTAAADACELSKCHARCSRDTYSLLCKQSDPQASAFLQKYIEDILKAVSDDFTELGMRSVLKAIMPKQCHYIFRPAAFFKDLPESEETDAGQDALAALFQNPQ
uniref:Chondroitin proteoglycan 4 domain-containing protein n=1 Tax=Plectus sambesii TaxID=2011161 RepID=A0A914X706_9BILA